MLFLSRVGGDDLHTPQNKMIFSYAAIQNYVDTVHCHQKAFLKMPLYGVKIP